MKKSLLVAALLAVSAHVASAESYNRVSLSCDYTFLSPNSHYPDQSDLTTNGAGLSYKHGFGVAKNMFVETGISFDYLGSSQTDIETINKITFTLKEDYNNFNIQVPVNYVYRFVINDRVSIAPYAGLDFKIHCMSTVKDKFINHNDDSETELKVNLFSENDMGSKDKTWNRFQMGWHIGAGVNFRRVNISLEYGTDFIPVFSYKSAKINSSNLKISLGYTF